MCSQAKSFELKCTQFLFLFGLHMSTYSVLFFSDLVRDIQLSGIEVHVFVYVLNGMQLYMIWSETLA